MNLLKTIFSKHWIEQFICLYYDWKQHWNCEIHSRFQALYPKPCHISRLPDFHTAILRHFHTTTLPYYQTSTLPDFHYMTLPHYHTSTLSDFHTAILTTLPHFHSQTSTLPDLPDFHTAHTYHTARLTTLPYYRTLSYNCTVTLIRNIF